MRFVANWFKGDGKKERGKGENGRMKEKSMKGGKESRGFKQNEGRSSNLQTPPNPPKNIFQGLIIIVFVSYTLHPGLLF